MKGEVKKNILISGSRRGIGRYLTEYYLAQGHTVIGCSKNKTDLLHNNYTHFCLDIADNDSVLNMFFKVQKNFSNLDILINNAGIAAMNHSTLMPSDVALEILQTNIHGPFLMSRESAK